MMPVISSTIFLMQATLGFWESLLEYSLASSHAFSILELVYFAKHKYDHVTTSPPSLHDYFLMSCLSLYDKLKALQYFQPVEQDLAHSSYFIHFN